jgi:ubiquinone biosynthesis protein Coq4
MAFFAFEDRDRRLAALTRGWNLGKAARPLFGVRWAEPIGYVRRELGLA